MPAGCTGGWQLVEAHLSRSGRGGGSRRAAHRRECQFGRRSSWSCGRTRKGGSVCRRDSDGRPAGAGRDVRPSGPSRRRGGPRRGRRASALRAPAVLFPPLKPPSLTSATRPRPSSAGGAAPLVPRIWSVVGARTPRFKASTPRPRAALTPAQGRASAAAGAAAACVPHMSVGMATVRPPAPTKGLSYGGSHGRAAADASAGPRGLPRQRREAS